MMTNNFEYCLNFVLLIIFLVKVYSRIIILLKNNSTISVLTIKLK